MNYRVEIIAIHIRNFRSIQDETIYLKQCNVFVGLNDSGKSNVLKALNLFFNGETDFGKDFDFETDYCKKPKTGLGKAKEITIELDLKMPKQVTDKGRKIWKKVWREDGLHINNINELFGAYSKGTTFLKRMRFEYVPAVKSDNYFRDLLQKMYQAMMSSANHSLRAVNDNFSVVLRETTSDFNANVKAYLGIDSVIQMPDDLGVLFRDMKISTTDEYISDISLAYRGDGIKARHIPSMLRFISQRIKEAREKNAIGYTVIWGYEEPENGVEFLACKKLAEELYTYSKECQLLITTHSPAIYSTCEKGDVVCFFTSKKDNGLSKYITDYPKKEIDIRMGIMPLIAEHYNAIFQELEKTENENKKILENLEQLKAQIEENDNKIYIYTEGITDQLYLQSILLNEPYYSRLVFNYKIEESDFGDSNLETRYTAMQTNIVDNIKIFMFDRDNTSYIIPSRYVKGRNKTYKFSIPVPSHRNQSDAIAIEHYFEDNEITTADATGYRLFMVKEFSREGVTKDDRFFCRYVIRQGNKNPLHILDGRDDNSIVCRRGETKNITLPKKKFAEYVVNRKTGFDFDMSEFDLIKKVIEEIIVDGDSSESE